MSEPATPLQKAEAERDAALSRCAELEGALNNIRWITHGIFNKESWDNIRSLSGQALDVTASPVADVIKKVRQWRKWKLEFDDFDGDRRRTREHFMNAEDELIEALDKLGGNYTEISKESQQ